MEFGELITTAQQSITFLSGSTDLVEKLRKLAKGSKDGKVSASEATALALKLQEEIIDAKNAQSTILNELLNFKQRMVELDRREQIQARYEIDETPEGAFVLRLKNENMFEEPMHYICQKCAERGERHILQTFGRGKQCLSCDSFYAFEPMNW